MPARPTPRGRSAFALAVVAIALAGTISAAAAPEPIADLTPTIAPLPLRSGLPAAPGFLRALEHRSVLLRHSGDSLVVLVRHAGSSPYVVGLPQCVFQRIVEVDSAWACALHVDGLESSILDIPVMDGTTFVGYAQFRGKRVGLPPSDRPLTSGRLVRYRFQSTALGQSRSLAVYVPNVVAGRPLRALYIFDLGDHPEGVVTLVDSLIAKREIEPTLVIALPTPATVLGAGDLRIREMVAGVDVAAYRRHETFFFDELLPFVRKRWGASADPDDITIVGASASAGWVLNQAPDHVNVAHAWAAFALPQSASIPDERWPATIRVTMGGGTFDQAYLAASLSACVTINRNGGSCRFFVVRAGHSQGAWAALLMQTLLDRPRRQPDPPPRQ